MHTFHRHISSVNSRRLLNAILVIGTWALLMTMAGEHTPVRAQTAVEPQIKHLYVAAAYPQYRYSTVFIHDPITLQTYGSVPIGSDYIYAMSATPNGERVYVAHSAGISVIDTTSKQTIALLPLPNRRHMVMGMENQYAYMRNETFVEVLELATHTIIDRIDVGVYQSAYPSNRQEMLLSPDGRFLYVGLSSRNQIAVVDIIERSVTATIDVSAYVDELLMPSGGERLYVALRTNAVDVIDLTTNTLAESILFPDVPDYAHIAITPDGSTIYIYTPNYGQARSNLYKFNAVTHELLERVAWLSAPGASGLNVGPDGKVYMLSFSPPESANVNRFDPLTGSQTIRSTGFGPRLVEFVPGEPDRIVVNSTADPGDGSCDASECTLREAIVAANAAAERQLIAFNIPGDGPHMIRPTSALPAITRRVTIDGYTQPGAEPNTNPVTAGTNARLKVGIDFGSMERQLTLQSEGSVVRGLVIAGAYRIGIQISGRINQIAGNFIGTEFTGTVARQNGIGVQISEGSGGTMIGGTTAADRNLISGNRLSGMMIAQQPQIALLGNLVGLDSSGQQALGNFRGIEFVGGNVPDAWPMYVGGVDEESRNVISGNEDDGLHLQYGSVLVQNNYIGTDVTGSLPVGNGDNGIGILGFNHRVINNLIAFNGRYGVWNANFDGPGYTTVANNRILYNETGVGVARGLLEIRENVIFGNRNYGIDLNQDGPTLNDIDDLDSGPNDLLNYPIIHVTANDGQAISLFGEFNSQANQTYQLSYFANSSCAVHGQGEIYLGTYPLTLGSAPRTYFNVTLPAQIPQGYTVSATTAATIPHAPDVAVITSEFAPCHPLAGVVNEHLQVVAMNYQYVPYEAYPHPDAPAGRFDLSVTFANESVYKLTNLMLKVATLTNNNVVFGPLQGATAGEGALFLTHDWPAGESRTFTFQIGLQERIPFDFYIDIYGLKTRTVVDGFGTAEEPLDEIAVDQSSLGHHFDQATIDLAPVAKTERIYLPLIAR